ncbi:hypothetical protein ACFHWW_27210 [Ensifer sp. P24N7]|uniref:hypothetical protein n=1 Tax=Sinorhizobium sp. P24N7 TaxID=3348358 RepID=UPI0035F4657A
MTLTDAIPEDVMSVGEAEPESWTQFLDELETWCCELPDRTSPADAPEMMLIDREELHMIAGKVRDHLYAALPSEPAAVADVVAWIYEDELPKSYPYDAMFPYSKVDGVRLFPVFAPPAPQPVPGESDPLGFLDWRRYLK